jgi:hypothetical protein
LCCCRAQDGGSFGLRGWRRGRFRLRLEDRLHCLAGGSSGFLEESGGGKASAKELVLEQACLWRGALARGLLPDEEQQSGPKAPGEGRHLQPGSQLERRLYAQVVYASVGKPETGVGQAGSVPLIHTRCDRSEAGRSAAGPKFCRRRAVLTRRQVLAGAAGSARSPAPGPN